jgi:hypothetical protein
MAVEFSHFEAQDGVRVVRGEHVVPLKKLFGAYRVVNIVRPDPVPA